MLQVDKSKWTIILYTSADPRCWDTRLPYIILCVMAAAPFRPLLQKHTALLSADFSFLFARHCTKIFATFKTHIVGTEFLFGPGLFIELRWKAQFAIYSSNCALKTPFAVPSPNSALKEQFAIYSPNCNQKAPFTITCTAPGLCTNNMRKGGFLVKRIFPPIEMFHGKENETKKKESKIRCPIETEGSNSMRLAATSCSCRKNVENGTSYTRKKGNLGNTWAVVQIVNTRG